MNIIRVRNRTMMGMWKGVFMEKLRRKKFLLENFRNGAEFHGWDPKGTSLGGVYVVLMMKPD
jgi:hypothetical protein